MYHDETLGITKKSSTGGTNSNSRSPSPSSSPGKSKRSSNKEGGHRSSKNAKQNASNSNRMVDDLEIDDDDDSGVGAAADFGIQLNDMPTRSALNKETGKGGRSPSGTGARAVIREGIDGDEPKDAEESSSENDSSSSVNDNEDKVSFIQLLVHAIVQA
ncbi:hypothetical protein RFI_33515 [Reticulomyxa filosa]|uniref:Uncharacterized protein n=1 Tax=Reticulomyxa filosa TaxID=46433 RepID=X6LS16_RETFI|nr:hypothetical protein RFI_33515 [Reticulomyxa filosa]|eukprot:ETO03887.1 hypothetical protein RFI_33515 [Reticulomyxa filosa]